MVNLNLVKPNHLWYAIGLIVADGNLSIDGRHINITSKDREVLIKVKKALSLTNKLGIKARAAGSIKKYSLLQFGDIKFYEYLLEIGLTPNKSLTLGPIQVPDEYFCDFLRGVIDGDGSIHVWLHKSNQHIQWALRITSGAWHFSNWLKEKIEKEFSVRGKLYAYKFKNKKNPIHLIKFGKFAAKVILRRIYYPDCLAMSRKLEQAKKCLETKNGFTKYGQVVFNHSSPGAEIGIQN